MVDQQVRKEWQRKNHKSWNKSPMHNEKLKKKKAEQESKKKTAKKYNKRVTE